MSLTNPSLNDIDFEIAEGCARFYDDPLGFVLWAFPWGQPGPLAAFSGPDIWQAKFLRDLGAHIKQRRFDGANAVLPIRMGTGSGRGIGKSALSAMLVCFILSTRQDSKITMTANTFPQLEARTWAEAQAWMKMCITAHWFEITGSKIYQKQAKESWFAVPQTSREENSQSFAGQQNARSTSAYIFDESSTIPDKIAEVADSGLTTGEPMFFAFGNVTDNKGFFYRSLFGSDAKAQIRSNGKLIPKWDSRAIDSRTCKFPNKDFIQDALETYGEDSDYFRVWVRGLAPATSALQFFAQAEIEAAQVRSVSTLRDEPLILGGDLSWGGNDPCCFRFRQGNDARSIKPVYFQGEQCRDPNFLVLQIAQILTKRWGPLESKVAMLFLDSAGICGPVAHRLRQLGHHNIQEVNFGAHSLSPKYKFMRSYMIGRVREALPYLAIDSAHDQHGRDLADDMRELQYGLTSATEILLERKDLVRKRLGRSTDDLDGLALTYAGDVEPETVIKERRRQAQWRPASAMS